MKNCKNLLLLLTGVASFSLTSCNGGKTVRAEDLIIPTYNSTQKVNIGAWSWTSKNLTAAQLQGIQEAGMNVMIGTFNGDNENADTALLKNAKNYDIGFILDRRNWNGEVPTFASYDNFLGMCVCDEPRYSDLETVKSKKQLWDQTEGLKDKMFYVNLNPSYSALTNIGKSYEDYIKKYTEDVGLDMVSTDYYPLYEDEDSDSGVSLRDDWLLDLSMSAHYAKKNNVPLWFTLLTTQHTASNLHYINPDARDLEYQMYVAMAFGTKYLIHYTYAATGADHINPIINSKGQPTDSYDDVKESSERIRQWDDFYMDFNWIGASGVYGTRSRNSLIDALYYELPLKETGVIKAATSTQDVIIGHFEDKDQNKGFVITNLTNPYLEKSAKTTLSFDSSYKGVKVFQDGNEKVSVLQDGKIDLNIAPGEGVFIIPLKAK